MERWLVSFELRPGTEREYERRHAEIWPELTAAITAAGISNHSLFRRGTTVVGYCECEPDAATAFAVLGATEAHARWSRWFEGLIVESGQEGDGPFRTYDEVWHLA